ncbi:hypothetical protein [Comamonas testosteroni]|nr:hypothetical protein U0024_06370 [Comamonas testosteroni]
MLQDLNVLIGEYPTKLCESDRALIVRGVGVGLAGHTLPHPRLPEQ